MSNRIQCHLIYSLGKPGKASIILLFFVEIGSKELITDDWWVWYGSKELNQWQLLLMRFIPVGNVIHQELESQKVVSSKSLLWGSKAFMSSLHDLKWQDLCSLGKPWLSIHSQLWPWHALLSTQIRHLSPKQCIRLNQTIPLWHWWTSLISKNKLITYHCSHRKEIKVSTSHCKEKHQCPG